MNAANHEYINSLISINFYDEKLFNEFYKWTLVLNNYFLIGILPKQIANFLGIECLEVYLTPDSYLKQLDSHPDLHKTFYAVVPFLLREGDVYEQCPPRRVVFVWEPVPGLGFHGTVKATSKGEAFLVSFFRAKKAHLRKTRLRYRQVNLCDGTC